jgi:membrane protein
VSWLARITRRFGDPGKTTGPGAAPFADPAVKALRDAAADAQRSRLPQMAAALSYRTIFGLIPVLIVALLVVQAFFPQKQREVLKLALERTGISTITLRDDAPVIDAPPPADLVGPPVPPEIAATLSRGSRDVEEWLNVLIARAESTISFKAIGLIGLATLVYAAIAMLVEIERAFNQIFRVPRGRSWIRRIANYWTLLTLGSAGLIATFFVGARFERWAEHVAESRGWIVGSSALTVQLIGYAVTVLISTAMLTLVYEVVPNTRVKPAPAALGAFLAALLWEAGKLGFAQYVLYSTGYAKIYGSLALVPLFLLWVYYTWLIVLFGLEVTYQLQHGRSKTSAQPLSDFGPTVVEASSGLLLMTAVARAMASGSPQSVRSLTQSTGLSEPVVSLVVARFAERGLLLRVERGGASGGSDPLYTLARTPGSIRVAEILSIGFELAGGPEANAVIARLRQAQIDAAGSETLADTAGLTGDSPSKPAHASPADTGTPGQNPPIPLVSSQTAGSTNGSGPSRPATLH